MTAARTRSLLTTLAAMLALAVCANARADDAPAPSQTPALTQAQEIEAEKSAARAAVEKAKIVGPANVALRDQGALALPEGFSFVPQPEAGRLMLAFGNANSGALIGLVLPPRGGANWWATLDYVKSGYVKDDDAKNWNADELLTNLKQGTENQNQERAKRGFPAIEITGWIEPPAYDSPTHRLIWSALVRQIGAAEGQGSVNYNTYALGREGYFSLDLITSKSAIEADKSAARTLLAAISYNKGKGYDDFNASSDHIAEFGLAALIGGVALKKLGLLALGAAFALKFAKLIGLGALVVVAAVRRLWRRPKPTAAPK